jgi:hypothetical protein
LCDDFTEHKLFSEIFRADGDAAGSWRTAGAEKKNVQKEQR